MADRPLVFFDMELDGEPAGRITMELRADITPLTAENFRCLCTGELGRAQGGLGKRLHFKGSIFHRIIPDFMCQGGDFTNSDGTGGESIYGATFADENFALKHDTPGVLSMANAGKNTNGSQFFLCTVPCPWLDGKHVVFGRVVEGISVVKSIEACGTRSGKPKQRVSVANSGQLANRLETMLKLKKEKEELAKLKDSAPVVNADQESLRRLQELRGGVAPIAQAGTRNRNAERHNETEDAVDATVASGAAGKAASSVQHSPDGTSKPDEQDDEEPKSHPTEGMSERQRKFYEIKQKLNQARKANQGAAIAEKKKNQRPKDENEVSEVAKYKWFQEKQKRKATELERLGVGSDEAHRLETAEAAHLQYQKREKKGAAFGWDAFNQKSLYNAYKKRAGKMNIDLMEYEKAKAQNPEFYRTADSLQHGKPVDDATENIDRMVSELNERDMARKKFSRRRTYHEDKDIDFINERNAHFNKKIERAFGQYTQEIKANLERGTALPD